MTNLVIKANAKVELFTFFRQYTSHLMKSLREFLRGFAGPSAILKRSYYNPNLQYGMRQDSLAGDLLKALSEIDFEISTLLGWDFPNLPKNGGAERAILISRAILKDTQNIFSRFWPQSGIVSMLVTVDPEDNSSLLCYAGPSLAPVPERIPFDGTLAGSVFQTKQSCFVPDVQESKFYTPEIFELLKKYGIKSQAACPIRNRSIVIAVLEVNSQERGTFRENEITRLLLFSLAQKLSLVFQVLISDPSKVKLELFETGL